jgi:hypothetical protein
MLATLLLLSATPHQGNHFQFWMLIQLLNPTLFKSVDEMVDQRHRLSTVVFRRTKADACQSDGSSLFARRWVHTESFVMSSDERRFYEYLQQYLQDGFDLAKRKGSQGQALGFLMAIFQKIAASSFAAVRRTLQRRLLMLIIHEAILRDRDLDIDGREKLYAEGRDLIHEEYGLLRDPIGRGETDRILADLKLRLVKRLDEEELELASDPYGSEYASVHAEELAGAAISLHLPEERTRIREVLGLFPQARETKIDKLLSGLGVLWRQNPQEKVVVFATYLGTVDLIAKLVEATYPGQGVAVLRGGDHGAKLAAERRFRQKDGPRVLVCTAAGREGINLQFARVLFNFDLPWNPMDIEQRIGRIHRYGQRDTAQVYNLVLSDTIEGRIFLLLNDKLDEIARTLGKIDEHGNVAEDLRAQILGQLSERLNYDRLYLTAISDPELRRTKVELEAALSNASEARQVVFELFQDLEGFSLEEYKPFADVSGGLGRLRDFLNVALQDRGQRLETVGEHLFELRDANLDPLVRFTDDRDKATSTEGLELLGLDHPVVEEALGRARATAPEDLGVAVQAEDGIKGVASWWLIEAATQKGERRSFVLPLVLREDGTRVPQAERNSDRYFTQTPVASKMSPAGRLEVLHRMIEPTLQRELRHRGVITDEGSFTAELLTWIELTSISAA